MTFNGPNNVEKQAPTKAEQTGLNKKHFGGKNLFLFVQLQAFSGLGKAKYNQACTNNQINEKKYNSPGRPPK